MRGIDQVLSVLREGSNRDRIAADMIEDLKAMVLDCQREKAKLERSIAEARSSCRRDGRICELYQLDLDSE